MRGLVLLKEAKNTSDDRVVLGKKPARGVCLRSREPRPKGRDENKIQQTVQHGFLAGRVSADFIPEKANQVGVPFVLSQNDQGGESSQDASTDFARKVIRPGKHHRLPAGVVPPGPYAETVRQRDLASVDGCAALAGVNHDPDRRRRIVGHGVGIGATDDRDISAGQSGRCFAVAQKPGRSSNHRHNRQRRLVFDPNGPRRSEHRAQHKRAAGPGAVEETGKGVHHA